jgi:hypothetical protein
MMEGSRTVLLCKRGRTLCHAVMLDGTVDAREFPVRAWWHPEEFGLRPLFFEQIGGVYPTDYAALRLLEAGLHVGITERAKRLLVPLLGVPRNLDETLPTHTEASSKEGT